MQDQGWHSSSSLAARAAQLLRAARTSRAHSSAHCAGCAPAGAARAPGATTPQGHLEKAACQLPGATREALLKFLPNVSPESWSAARRASNLNRSGVTWRSKHKRLSSNSCNNALYRELQVSSDLRSCILQMSLKNTKMRTRSHCTVTSVEHY